MSSGRTDEVPRYVVVSNFREVSLFDLELEKSVEDRTDSQLADFHRHVKYFAFVAGQKAYRGATLYPALT